MRKTDDSLNAMGRTMIVTDKPTRAKLKARADAEGLPLSMFLRKVANEGQGSMVDLSTPVTKKDLGELNYTNMGTMAIIVTTLMAVILDFYGLHPDKAMKSRLEHEFWNRIPRNSVQPELELDTA